MDFADFLRVMWRGRNVIVVGLLLMLGAAVGIVKYVPTNYEASGNVLILLPPDDGTGAQAVNPYLNTPQGLTLAAVIIGGVVTTNEEQRSLAEAGFLSEYAVAQSPASGIPLLTVSAQGADPVMAQATVMEVIRRIEAELNRMQDEVRAPKNQRMIAHTFSVTNQAEVVTGSKVRALAALGAVGGIVMLLAVFGLERRRKRSRSGAGRSHRAQRRFGRTEARTRPETSDKTKARIVEPPDRGEEVPRAETTRAPVAKVAVLEGDAFDGSRDEVFGPAVNPGTVRS